VKPVFYQKFTDRFLACSYRGEYILEYRYEQVWIIAKKWKSAVGQFLESIQKTTGGSWLWFVGVLQLLLVFQQRFYEDQKKHHVFHCGAPVMTYDIYLSTI